MNRVFVFFLLGLFLVPLILGGSPTLAQESSGKSIFDDKCAMCHGTDGKGNGPAASSFNPAPKDFNTPAFWQDMTRTKIKDTIENGHGPMPAVDLSSSQIKAVIDYMEQSFKK
ncbi:MAG: cytochrome c [Syntrophales bacterium]|nr:cytochrome c [Syntrophales bacterium]